MAVVIAAVIPVAAGCAQPSPPSVPSASSASAERTVPTTTTNPNIYLQQRAEGVTALLETLDAALLVGDHEALDALLDPGAPVALRARLETITDNLSATGEHRKRGTALRFAEFTHRLSPTEEAEIPAPPQTAAMIAAQGGSDSWVAPILFRYALGGAGSPGIDESTITVPGQLVVARYGDVWKLVDDESALSNEAADPQHPDSVRLPTMWEIPGLLATDVDTAGGASVVASYPETEGLVRATVAALPGAVRAVTAFWGEKWARKAVVVATGGTEEFDALTRTEGVGAGVAAATVHTTLDLEAGDVTGLRIVLAPQARSLAAPLLAVVLRHELFHVAARADTHPSAPLWISEGVAEYVGRKGSYTRVADAAPDLIEQVRNGIVPTMLPSDEEFDVEASGAVPAYQSAWSFAAFVAERYGEDRLRALYRAAAGSASADADRRPASVIGAQLATDAEQVMKEWGRWLEDQAR